MIECCENPRLACEPGAGFLPARELQRQNLQRDVAAQRQVPRTQDLAHASGAEDADDFVRADARTGRQRRHEGFILAPVRISQANTRAHLGDFIRRRTSCRRTVRADSSRFLEGR
jgi:hypothetical protein